ncbi:hypothetical protein ACFZBM_37615 [Streptomyces lavendulae]|uniref:hypothetical protein n=1 Tax=Streptomyces lavendulae TaxID=1914 RepID=UPI0036EA6B97
MGRDRHLTAHHGRPPEVYGGFVPQSTVVVAEAASLVSPAQLPALYEEAAKAQGRQLALKVTNKLPEQDPLGVVRGIAVFVLLVAGYLGSTPAMQPTETAAARRRVLSLIGYAVNAGLVFDVIIGPVLGACPVVRHPCQPDDGGVGVRCGQAGWAPGRASSSIRLTAPGPREARPAWCSCVPVRGEPHPRWS